MEADWDIEEENIMKGSGVSKHGGKNKNVLRQHRVILSSC